MSKFGIGQPVTRTEDPRFLTGRGTYIDDIPAAGAAAAVVVRSPHAHATIDGIRREVALAMPGVLAVLTGADYHADGLGTVPILFMPEDDGAPKGYRAPRLPIALDRVRHVGDIVAYVVAETLAQAKDAAECLEIDYTPLHAVVRIEDALAPGAPLVWAAAPGNIGFTAFSGDKAATDAALIGARHVSRLSLYNNRIMANPMETRGTIGSYEPFDRRFTLISSSQGPHRLRAQLAKAIFGLPETQFRCINRDVGGGFGTKSGLYPEDALALWAARRVGRSVKWIAERGESLVSDAPGRDMLTIGEMGFDAAGRIIGFRVSFLANLGAYIANVGAVPAIFGATMLSNVYAIPALDVTIKGVFSHTTPTAPYRGAGRPEAAYLVERLIDQAADEMAIERVDLRRRNFIPATSMPYKTPLTYTYDSGEFEALMDKTLALADWDGFAARKAESARRGRMRGRGVAPYIEVCSVFNERMDVRFDPSGTVTIVAGTFSHGQGHETVFPQLVTEWLGVPFETIRLVQGDTDLVSFGRGTMGSRSSMLGGTAIRFACDAIIAKGKRLAAHMLEAAESDIEFADGAFRVAGTDKALGIVDVAKHAYIPAGLPRDLGIGLEGSGACDSDPPNFPNGCHVAEIEIDPETGRVEIARFAAVDDVGRVLNPLLVAGQVHGGLAQGIGQALLEEVVIDRESGQVLSGSFMDYCMPRADDLPRFDLGHHDVPSTSNPLGVKGVGEAGCVAAPPAVINAILDALRPLGVRDIDLPATPERVWRAISEAGGAR